MELWEVTLDGTTVTVLSGQDGAMTRQVRAFRNRLRALWEVDRLCAEREDAGFTLVRRDDERAPLVRSDFEAALRAEPDGEDNYLVHADWLQSQGDPSGQLIAVQHALMNTPPGSEQHRRLEREEAALLFEHRRHLWGALGDRVIDPHMQLYATELFAPDWHLGFLRSVEFQLLDIDLPSGVDGPMLARTLFDLHIAKLLRGVSVRPLGSREWPGLEALPGLIAELAPPTLRWLRFGQPDSWHQIRILRIGETLPALKSLSLCARELLLPPALPASATTTIEDLTLASYRVRDDLLAPLARATWPALHTLTIRIHRVTAQATTFHYEAGHLAPLLSGEHAPCLRSLTLQCTRDTDELCRLLASSRLADTLEYLDISFGALSSVGVDLLARRPFSRLRELVAIENPIALADARRLVHAAPIVKVHPLREEWDQDG